MPPLNSPPEEARRRQQLQLALHSTHGGPRVTSDLTQVIRLVRVTEEPPEDTTTCAAEQQRRGVDIRDLTDCSHDEYKSTQNGNIESNAPDVFISSGSSTGAMGVFAERVHMYSNRERSQLMNRAHC